MVLQRLRMSVASSAYSAPSLPHHHAIMATTIAQRLRSNDWIRTEVEAAIKGQALPQKALGARVARLCVVYALRTHLDFARSDEVDELCRYKGQEVFARARNAGLIMNDQLPDAELLHDKAWHPYCIHYPRVASEDTYRRLASAFPDLRYQVGRACAVAGYSQLYDELDIFPDVCIAEEARENREESATEGAQRIFERIMAAPTRYGVMNDYSRTIDMDNPKPGACLNADTQVLAMLQHRRRFAERFKTPWLYFNITEDEGINEEIHGPIPCPRTDFEADPPLSLYRSVCSISDTLTESEAALLDSPLPFNLPTTHKDLLILAAAYEGNVDRYARLRRPGHIIAEEVNCLVHGIYKSTAMAHWLDCTSDISDLDVTKAIHARRIMNNDVYHIIDADPPIADSELPYWIWWPTIPSPWTLIQLAEKRLAMRKQCARACMAGGYKGSYCMIMDMHDGVNKPLVVDRVLMYEARTCPEHDFFEPDMIRRMHEQGVADVDSLPPIDHPLDVWEMTIPWREADPSSDLLYGALKESPFTLGCSKQLERNMYEENDAEMGRVRLYLSSPPEARERAAEDPGFMYFNDDAPPLVFSNRTSSLS